MARVTPDLIDGEVRLSTRGDSVRRLFQVRELSGAPAGRLAQAVRASGVPSIGQSHPALGGVMVSDVRASATSDPTIAIVEVTYATPGSTVGNTSGATEISIIADLYTEETITDVNGVRIETTFFSTSALGAGSFSSSVQRQAHRIEVQRPTFSVQFTRIESTPPLDLARRFAGKVNASTFLNESADKWICGIDSSQQSANSHRVRYTFTLNTNGWQAQITHNSAGIVPPTVSIVNGIRHVQVYRRANFGALRLPSL